MNTVPATSLSSLYHVSAYIFIPWEVGLAAVAASIVSQGSARVLPCETKQIGFIDKRRGQ